MVQKRLIFHQREPFQHDSTLNFVCFRIESAIHKTQYKRNHFDMPILYILFTFCPCITLHKLSLSQLKQFHDVLFIFDHISSIFFFLPNILCEKFVRLSHFWNIIHHHNLNRCLIFILHSVPPKNDEHFKINFRESGQCT